MQLKSLFYFSSVVAVVFCVTVQDILDDLNTVYTQTTTLDNAIEAFPNSGGSLAAGLAIHTDATNVQSAIDTTTTAAKTLPVVSTADGRLILASVQAIEPIIIDALHQIIAKKAALQALPTGGIPALVGQDLKNLAVSTTALENALIALLVSDLMPGVSAVQSRIGAAFDTAIAAYSDPPLLVPRNQKPNIAASTTHIP